ncbi:hypothetical protein BDA96_10G009600 [Sorghum bicolor]|uniref:Uncharacterized protein n=2 Tax=Sorghum bicolor TaxID=4558 RepID=A0A921TZ13_SORBI|nr:hypothetical protein BDA96_10G009600 [Sorghum bicolor]KXG19128.2 hypothetical protein SORBI_3010G008500 [Sorghum bicolor]
MLIGIQAIDVTAISGTLFQLEALLSVCSALEHLLKHALEQRLQVSGGLKRLGHSHHRLERKICLHHPAHLHGQRSLAEAPEPHDGEHGFGFSRPRLCTPLVLDATNRWWSAFLARVAPGDDDATSSRDGERRSASRLMPYRAWRSLMAMARARRARISHARRRRGESVPSQARKPSLGLDAEPVQVDAVLGVVGELAELLHPHGDEVVHGAVFSLRLHAEQRVHGVQIVAQLHDLATDT